MSGPRLPLNHINGNNRRPNNLSRMPSAEKPQCAQHDDLIKYIFESWDKVSKELTMSGGNTNSVTYYEEIEPNPSLKDFKAFDLEAYWDRRMVPEFMKQAQHS